MATESGFTGTTENSYSIGDGLDGYKYLYANIDNNSIYNPWIRYNFESDRWEFSNDGYIAFEIIENHNELLGLDGGTLGEYYHFTSAEHTWLLDGYNDGYWNVDKGGTGITNYTIGDILYADTTSSLTTLSPGTDTQILALSGGVPVWQDPTIIHNLLQGLQGGEYDGYYHLTQAEHTWLTDGYDDGYWNVDKGGTGITNYTIGDLLYADTTTSLATLSPGLDTEILTLVGGMPVWLAPVEPILDHNLLDNLQGGNGVDGYYHLTQYEHTWLTDGYTAGYWDTDKGGTGLTSYTEGDILYADNLGALTTLAIGTSGYILSATISGPEWAEIPASSYVLSFTDADLDVDGYINLPHNLDNKYVIIQIYNDNDEMIVPDEVVLLDANTAEAGLVSFEPITGTWHAVVVLGGLLGVQGSGGTLYIEDGSLKYLGSNGTITVVAPA